MLLGRTELSCIIFFHPQSIASDRQNFNLFMGLIYKTLRAPSTRPPFDRRQAQNVLIALTQTLDSAITPPQAPGKTASAPAAMSRHAGNFRRTDVTTFIDRLCTEYAIMLTRLQNSIYANIDSTLKQREDSMRSATEGRINNQKFSTKANDGILVRIKKHAQRDHEKLSMGVLYVLSREKWATLDKRYRTLENQARIVHLLTCLAAVNANDLTSEKAAKAAAAHLTSLPQEYLSANQLNDVNSLEKQSLQAYLRNLSNDSIKDLCFLHTANQDKKEKPQNANKVILDKIGTDKRPQAKRILTEILSAIRTEHMRRLQLDVHTNLTYLSQPTIQEDITNYKDNYTSVHALTLEADVYQGLLNWSENISNYFGTEDLIDIFLQGLSHEEVISLMEDMTTLKSNYKADTEKGPNYQKIVENLDRMNVAAEKEILRRKDLSTDQTLWADAAQPLIQKKAVSELANIVKSLEEAVKRSDASPGDILKQLIDLEKAYGDMQLRRLNLQTPDIGALKERAFSAYNQFRTRPPLDLNSPTKLRLGRPLSNGRNLNKIQQALLNFRSQLASFQAQVMRLNDNQPIQSGPQRFLDEPFTDIQDELQQNLLNELATNTAISTAAQPLKDAITTLSEKTRTQEIIKASKKLGEIINEQYDLLSDDLRNSLSDDLMTKTVYELLRLNISRSLESLENGDLPPDINKHNLRTEINRALANDPEQKNILSAMNQLLDEEFEKRLNRLGPCYPGLRTGLSVAMYGEADEITWTDGGKNVTVRQGAGNGELTESGRDRLIELKTIYEQRNTSTACHLKWRSSIDQESMRLVQIKNKFIDHHAIIKSESLTHGMPQSLKQQRAKIFQLTSDQIQSSQKRPLPGNGLQ
ncbi:hypothetical protein ACTPOE_08385 [Castellaniella sp. WN]